MLSWLNLHDRPAVQVEALLTLTGISEMCQSGTTVAAAAARVAAAEAAGKKFSLSTLVTDLPTSFSSTMTTEAMTALDASLTRTIQQQQQQKKNSSSTSSSTLNSLTSSLSQSLGLTSSTTSSSGGSSSSTSYLALPTSDFSPLSSTSQQFLLRHEDAIPTLLSLLSNETDKQIIEQSMWVLGSIASGGENSSGSSSTNSDKNGSARDVLLSKGILPILLGCLDAYPTNVTLQRLGAWTLCNLVEGIFQTHAKKESSEEIKMAALLPVLRRLLKLSDAEVLSYTCWSLSHLCDGPSSHIAAVVTTPRSSKAAKGGLVPRLVELLLHPSWRVTKPALRTIGNIVCAECSNDGDSSCENTDYTEVIIDCGAVPFLKRLVTHNNREIQKEACWTLSNIAAGTVDQIQAVIDSGAIPPLVKLVSEKTTDQEVRSEACWVVLNATSCGSDSQIEVLVMEGCVSVLGVLLSEPSMVMMALEGLERVLQVEESREIARRSDKKRKNEPPAPMLVSPSLIEKAQDKHNSTAVKKRADRIWKQHFVSCALCHESYSKHRIADATFCEECKCHVCSKCDCKKYHLSYQEELWAATEEQTEAKKNAKKSKNKKKKQKQKKAKQANSESSSSQQSPTKGVTVETSGKLNSRESSVETGSRKSRGEESSDDGIDKTAADTKPRESRFGASMSQSDDELNVGGALDDSERQQPPIDFVLYLQQTGSIIALAKLMDALENDGNGNGYNDEELDDKELQLIRSMQQQATS